MTNIVTFKWRAPETGYKLPSACPYRAEHVNILHAMARRNGDFDRFIVITDEPDGIDPDIEIMPLWDDYLALGGCYNRLKMYAMPLGKFLMIDLDCVIVGDIQPLLDRPESLVLNRYCLPGSPNQHYNGALQLIESGKHCGVWEDFHRSVVPTLQAYRGTPRGYVGTDQAWLSYYLGYGVPTFGPEHGVRDIRDCEVDELPDNTRIVFFHGARDPSLSCRKWVVEHWWK